MAQYKKVAIVQDWLTGFGGGEQVLLALTEIFPEAPIYTTLYNPLKTPQFASKKVITSYLQNIPGAKNKHQLFIPLMPQAFESFNLKGYDLVISLGAFAKGVITQPDQVHINYCHTPIRYIWNLGGDNRASGWLKEKVAHGLRIWDVVSAERVDGFIANSKEVASRIEKIYRQKSTVIYPPVEISRFADQGIERKPRGYFITLGRLVSYKRVDLIVEACIQANKKLIVVGTGPDKSRLERLAQGSDLIEFAGRLSYQKLTDVLAAGEAFIMAAEEDFGIAPVEAMGAGCPVIAYGRGGLLETVQAGVSGCFFKEQTVESLAEVLSGFSSKDYDSEKIRNSVEIFDKKHFQKNIKQYIDQFQSF